MLNIIFSFRSEIELFLRDILHNQYCSCKVNYDAERLLLTERITDICEVIEDQKKFRDITLNKSAIDYNNLDFSLDHIFICYISHYQNTRCYGQFWLSLALIRYTIIQATSKVDFDVLDSVVNTLVNFADNHFHSFVTLHGGLSSIVNTTIEKPFFPFLSDYFDKDYFNYE